MRYALLSLFVVFLIGCAQPPSDVTVAQIEPSAADSSGNIVAEVDNSDSGDSKPIDVSASSFEFEGFGPGKSHTGTFDEISGTLIYSDGVVVGASGVIQAASVNTGIGGLDKHLKNDDFFDVENFPEIRFASSSLADGVMSGDLTFHGVTNEVSFPVEVTANSVTADFLLDTTPFGMKHTGVNKDVRISFTFVSS